MVKTLACVVITMVFAAGLIGCGGGGGGAASLGERITITAEFPAEGEGAEETITSAWVTVTGDGIEPVVQVMTYDALNHSAATAITVPVGTNYTVKVDARTSADVIVFTGEGTGVQVVAGVPLALVIPMAKPPEDSVAEPGATAIDYTNLTLTRTFTGHPREVTSVDFSPDGAWLASGCEYGTVKVWDPVTGYTLWTKSGGGNWCLSVAFSPDGNTLASASMEHAEDSTIKLWGAETGVKQLTLTGHESIVRSVDFSPDGSILASGSSDFTVKLWDPKTGVEKRTLTGHDRDVRSVAFSPDGITLASAEAGAGAVVKLWNVQTGTLIWTITTGSGWGGVAFSPDGTTLACLNENDEVKLLDVQTGLEKLTIAGHTGVMSLAFSPDGSTLASGSWYKTAKLWDVQTGVLTKTLLGHTGAIYEVAFSSDGRTLATGADDKTIKLWRVP